MRKPIDLVGQRFSFLTVLEYAGATQDTGGCALWLCVCDCGRRKIIRGTDLRRGRAKSCTCKRNELIGKSNRTHGATIGKNETPEYRIWCGMKERCYRKRHPHYVYYGGRGIKVCNRWRNSFENFLKDMGERPANLSLDRIDNDKDYCKSNCRWATAKEQHRNTRSNRLLNYNGQTKTLIEWSEIVGIGRTTIRERLSRGWSVADALNIKVGNKLRN